MPDELVQIKQLLSDGLFNTSDWVTKNTIERVQFLITIAKQDDYSKRKKHISESLWIDI